MAELEVISIPYDTPEWLSFRASGIGGSDAAAAIGRSTFKSNIQLWEEKLGLRVIPDISENPRVKYGKQSEDYLTALFALDYWHEEWRKGLNLFDDIQPKANSENNASWVSVNKKIRIVSTTNEITTKYAAFYCNLKSNRMYTLSINPTNSNYSYARIYENDNGGLGNIVKEVSLSGTFITPNKTEFFLLIYLQNDTPLGNNTEVNVMINEGNIPYPYEPYNGGIIRQSEVPIYYTTNIASPAQTIGGTWEKIGEFTVGSTTIHAWKRL